MIYVFSNKIDCKVISFLSILLPYNGEERCPKLDSAVRL